MTQSPRGTLHVNLHLLDRQVVDREGRLICKVDDLELTPADAGRPHVTAILVGPRAVGPRLRDRLGRWVTSIAGRVADGDIPRIDFVHVAKIGSSITLACDRADVDVVPLEDWVDEHMISRIPGSGHAS